MPAGILARYLFREGALNWLAVTMVLLLVMLATRFVRFLGAAAAGDIPPDLVFQVVALSGLQYLMVIAPISLLIGVMLALGRLYKDQEISAATACGVGLRAIVLPFAGLGVIAALLTSALAFDIGPRAGRTVDYLVKAAREQISYAPFESGRFTSLSAGRAVFYSGRADSGAGSFEQVFIRVDEPGYEGLITARAGSQRVDTTTGEREIVLTEGHRYGGEPGGLAWDITQFARFTMRVMPPDVIYVPSKTKIDRTRTLIERGDDEAWAELHWRISAPIAVLLMVLIAVPLSHVGPRQGRYSKVILGLLVYLVYANLLGLGQAWIAGGRISPVVGLWWVHAAALIFGLILLARRAGWRLR
jgi:lipopolysaccharide export system permease protein